jgi:Domain of unknown function (DUF4158)
LETLSRQLGLTTGDGLQTYRSSKQRWEDISKIREHYGYSDMTDPLVGFQLTRWLYGLYWTGRAAKQALRACYRLVVGAQNSVARLQYARTVVVRLAQQGRDQSMALVGTRHYE